MADKLAVKIKALIRELGPGTSILYLIDKLVRRVPGCGVYDYRFFAQEISKVPRLPPGRGKKYELRWIAQTESLLTELGRPESVIQDRFSQGAKCLVATLDGRLVGCIWYVQALYIEDEVRVDFILPDNRFAWDFDVYIADSERLGFLFARMWDYFDAQLRSQGIECSLSRINGFNARSIQSHRRLGAQLVGWASFLRIGKIQLMISSRSPFVHLSVRGRPRLRFEFEQQRSND